MGVSQKLENTTQDLMGHLRIKNPTDFDAPEI